MIGDKGTHKAKPLFKKVPCQLKRCRSDQAECRWFVLHWQDAWWFFREEPEGMNLKLNLNSQVTWGGGCQ